MPNYVTKISKSGGPTYDMKDKEARELIAAEASAREDAVDSIEEALKENIYIYKKYGSDSIEQGGYSYTVKVNLENRVRISRLINVSEGDMISNESNLLCFCRVMATPTETQTDIGNSGWISAGGVWIVTATGYMSVTFKNASDTSITPSSFSGYFNTGTGINKYCLESEKRIDAILAEMHDINVRSYTNLFNKDDEDITWGGYYDENGQFIISTTISSSGFIPVKPLTRYRATGWVPGSNITVTYWNSSKQFAGGTSETSADGFITIPEEGVAYIRILFYVANRDNVSICEGTDVPPSGIPYNTKIIFVDETNLTKVIDTFNIVTSDYELTPYSTANGVLMNDGTINTAYGNITIRKYNNLQNRRLFLSGAGTFSTGDGFCYVWFVKNGAMVSYIEPNKNPQIFNDFEIELENDADEVWICPIALSMFIKTAIDNEARDLIGQIEDQHSYWYNKKILWLGTSIPATAYEGGNSYPTIVGQAIGANIVNNSISGSCVRKRFDPDNIDTSVTYRWIWDLLSMVTSWDDVDELAENWATYKQYFDEAPDEMSQSDIARYKASSYQTVLDPYLSGSGKADLIVIDHGRNDLFDMLDQENLFDKDTFVGAMNWIIQHIYEVNPRARICLISHYESQEYPTIVEAQEYVANYWSIPLFRLDKILGWNNRSVTTKHGWVDGYYIETVSTNTTTIKNAWCADGLHPNSDKSGEAVNLIAHAIIPWIKTIV